ncbi:MAG TPA: FMN-binding protein [Anaeromyxobacteraceae bacterium]|nr:FMN-binding protein [Anaeromyxobacteraceae bacterium]
MKWQRIPVSVSWSLLAPAAALPAPAFAVEYLTPHQAEAALFPEADSFEARELTLPEMDRRTLQARLGLPVRNRWVVHLAWRGGQLLGTVVLDDVIGKFDRITFATGVGSDGSLRPVEILAYRESHGGEVRMKKWRDQFLGRNEASALRVGDDIANISGATLSCQHVTEGVRRIVAIVGQFRRSGVLR